MHASGKQLCNFFKCITLFHILNLWHSDVFFKTSKLSVYKMQLKIVCLQKW